MWSDTLQPGPRWQWERWDSQPPNGAVNCGPTSVCRILDFYRDRTHNINAVRRGAGVPDYAATSPSQQKAMLERNGVSAYIAQPSVDTLTALVAGGRHPVIVGLYMARVPAELRDHPFTGMHAITLLRNRSGWWGGRLVPGKVYLDPNFSPAINRLDPDDGRKWMPDSVVRWAFVSSPAGTNRGWAVIPSKAKLVLVPAPAPSPTAEVHPMLIHKAQAWRARTGGAPAYETPGGKFIRTLPVGTQLTSIGETLDGLWRQVWIEVSGQDRWVYIKRATLEALPPPPASRTASGDPAFVAAVKALLLRRAA
jgi:hypothetical protein